MLMPAKLLVFSVHFWRNSIENIIFLSVLMGKTNAALDIFICST